MLIFDCRTMGNRMLKYRKKAGLTQAELAERAGISDRAYAEIERGSVNLRVETLLHICRALGVTPDELLVEDDDNLELRKTDVLEALDKCSPQRQRLALKMLDIYLKTE